VIGKAILYGGAGGFLLSFSAVIGLQTYFESFPKAPLPSHGLVVAHGEHGVDYFITARLATAFDWASGATAICFVIIAIGAYLTQDKYGRPK
jgi:hypothetical protein